MMRGPRPTVADQAALIAAVKNAIREGIRTFAAIFVPVKAAFPTVPARQLAQRVRTLLARMVAAGTATLEFDGYHLVDTDDEANHTPRNEKPHEEPMRTTTTKPLAEMTLAELEAHKRDLHAAEVDRLIAEKRNAQADKAIKVKAVRGKPADAKPARKAKAAKPAAAAKPKASKRGAPLPKDMREPLEAAIRTRLLSGACNVPTFVEYTTNLKNPAVQGLNAEQATMRVRAFVNKLVKAGKLVNVSRGMFALAPVKAEAASA